MDIRHFQRGITYQSYQSLFFEENLEVEVYNVFFWGVLETFYYFFGV